MQGHGQNDVLHDAVYLMRAASVMSSKKAKLAPVIAMSSVTITTPPLTGKSVVHSAGTKSACAVVTQLSLAAARDAVVKSFTATAVAAAIVSII